jgi:hypothetical protein
MFLYLCKVYVKLDQPMNALDYFQKVKRERGGGGRERGRRKDGEGGEESERERVSKKNTTQFHIISIGIGKIQE